VRFGCTLFTVIPAKAGIQPLLLVGSQSWIPAFAGMTMLWRAKSAQELCDAFHC
jgi:hypothetical protein